MSEAIAKALRLAAAKTERNPSDAAKEAGNYAKGKVAYKGLTIAIENPKGSERTGVDKGGKRWSVRMPAAYGYVLGTEGKDGDHVDVYLGPEHDSDKVYVVDQVNAESGRFDEHKVMLSYPSKSAAVADYEKAFSDGKGKDRIGSVTEMSTQAFKDWLKSGDTKKPLGTRHGYASGGRVGDMDDSHRRALELALALTAGSRRGFAEGGTADDALTEALRNISPSVITRDLPTGRESDGELRNADRYSSVRPMSERALSAAYDLSTAPAKMAVSAAMQPVRAGEAIGDAAFDPTVGKVTNAGFQAALTLFRPAMALKAYGAGLGLTAADQLGLSPFGAANAADALTESQRKKLTDLEAKYSKRSWSNTTERNDWKSEIERLRKIETKAAEALNETNAKTAGTKAEAEIAAKAAADAEALKEYSRSVQNAERLRKEAEDTNTSFRTSKLGKFYEETGGTAPIIAGIAAGMLPRIGVSPGAVESALKRYGLPALEGAGAVFAGLNAPLIYDSFSTPKKNPMKEALEVYSRELPVGHPRKQEFADYAKNNMKDENPVQKQAWDDLTSLDGMKRRAIAAIGEGVPAGILGSYLPTAGPAMARGLANGIGAIPGAIAEGFYKSKARANEAKGAASAAQHDAAQVQSTALRAQSDAVQDALALAEQQKLLRQAERRSSGQAIPDLEGQAPTARPRPTAESSESLSPLLPPSGTRSIVDELNGSGPAIGADKLQAGRVVHDLSPEAEAILQRLFGGQSAGNKSLPTESFRDFKKVAPGEGKWASEIAPTARDVMLRRADEGVPMWPKQGSAIFDDIASALPSGVTTNKTDVQGRLKNMREQVGENAPTRAQLEEFFANAPGSLSKGRKVFSSVPIGAGLGYAASGDDAAASESAPKTIIKTKHPSGHWQHRNEDGTFTSLPGKDDAKKNGGRIKAALDIARRYANGGKVLAGPVVGHTGGREDALPVEVAAGSFVIPADIVSSLGTGNTGAGHLKLEQMFGKPVPHRAAGGSVPIRISDGEFVVTPDQVAKIGGGDMDLGHKVLDALVLKLRHEHINTLKSLPPPSR